MLRRLIRPFLILFLVACRAAPATAGPTPPLATDTTAPLSSPTPGAPASTATVTPVPPALLTVANPALIQIDFQDTKDGWGIAANDSGYVLRTVDGGRTWLNATPTGLSAVGFSTSLFVLNVNTVWLLAPGTDFFSAVLYHSLDGGATWASNPVPFGGAWLQFVDASNGRALADRGAAAGSQAVELFQTADGGVTWTSVFHDNPIQSGSSDALPFGGIKSGMVFFDANTGWVTGSQPIPGNVYLYRTQDGGSSWAAQALPLPAQTATDQFVTQPPVFFGSQGFLPLRYYTPGGGSAETVFVSQDGGATWSGDPAAPNRSIPSGIVAAADPLHAWSWDGGPQIYSTADGALTWSAAPTSPDLSEKLARLEFVPNGPGSFIGWALSSLDENGHSQLYTTNDNGATWTPVVP